MDHTTTGRRRAAGCLLCAWLLGLVCLPGATCAQRQHRQLGRRLLQAGPARFMNAPILSEQALESAAVSPTRRRQQPAVAAAAVGQQPELPRQPRGLLAADSHGDHQRRHGGGYSLDRRARRRPQWRQYGRYDRAALSPWVAPVNSYAAIRPQALPLLSGLLGGLLKLGNPQSTAQSLAQAYSGGQSDAAAQAVASAFAGDGSSSAQASTTMSQAMAEMAASHPSAAPGLLAKSANLAVTRGRTQQYANTLANAFGYAKQQSQVPQLTSALCSAIETGGDPARYASGEAIAKAIASGGDSKAAVAEATATALCAGGSTAQAWSSAYAIALSKDSNGCLVLNEAKAMAQAKCDGASEAISNAEASSNVLGFCGMLDGFFPDTDMSWSGGNSGGTAGGSGGGFGGRPYGGFEGRR